MSTLSSRGALSASVVAVFKNTPLSIFFKKTALSLLFCSFISGYQSLSAQSVLPDTSYKVLVPTILNSGTAKSLLKSNHQKGNLLRLRAQLNF